jgi:hypothetical protein
MTSKVVKKRAAQTLEEQRQRRLKRRLIVGGAVVVLVTFLIKEVLRDWLKGLSESIAAAQNVESQEEDRTMLLVQQERLSIAQGQLAALANPQQKAAAVSKINLQTEIGTLQQLCAQAAADVANTSALLDKLPQRGEGARYLRAERDHVQQDLQKLQKETKNTVTNLVPMMGTTWESHVSVLIEIIGVNVFELEVVVWDTDVASAAKRTKEAADRLYELCTWMFYFFYIVGVGLGLWGALLGIEVAPSE